VNRPIGRRRRRGQALVEFALVLPLLLLMVFGIVDAGRLIYAYNTVSNSARNGARVAIVNQSTSGAETCDTTATTPGATAWPVGCAISSGIGLGIKDTDVTVTYRDVTDTQNCQPPPATDPPVVAIGCIAVVEVTGKFQPLTPVIGQIIGAVDVKSTTKIPVERVCTNPPPSPIPSC
jgi:Flp pilus assembly protein TadG